MLIIDEIDALKQRISSLEEYCLNVDHHHLPVPAALSYLFEKTHGTYTYPDGRVYEGDLIKGRPSGLGRIRGDEYSEEFDGLFLNGLKHGSFVCLLPNGDESERRYLYDKLDGEKRTVDEEGNRFSSVYMDGRQRHVFKKVYVGGAVEFIDCEDYEYNGYYVRYDPAEDTVNVSLYEDGHAKGNRKKYVYKSEV